MGKNKKYTEAFKQETLALADRLKNSSEAARQVGINGALIWQWRKHFKNKSSSPTLEKEQVKMVSKSNHEILGDATFRQREILNRQAWDLVKKLNSASYDVSFQQYQDMERVGIIAKALLAIDVIREAEHVVHQLEAELK